MHSPKLSIVILDYMKGEKVLENVKYLCAQKTNFEKEIIVVDNSISKKNAKILEQVKNFPNTKLIVNTENIGYTKGNNIGVKASFGEYIAILNPDIVVDQQGTLQTLVDHLETHSDTGILAPKQNNPDGSVAMSVRAFPTLFVQIARRTILRKLPFFRAVVEYDEMRHLDYTKTQDVDWLQSSFFLMKRSFWEELGGFNEEYFLFMADTEMCWKTWKKGKKVVYFPNAQVSSDGIRCSQGGIFAFFKNWVLRRHCIDSLLYTKNHFFEKNPREERKG